MKNALGRTRTCNLRFRRPSLYPIELRVLFRLSRAFYQGSRNEATARGAVDRGQWTEIAMPTLSPDHWLLSPAPCFAGRYNAGMVGAAPESSPLDLAELLGLLADVVRSYGRVVTAYTGGIESTLVAAVARQVLGRENAPAVLAVSPETSQAERDEAIAVARQLDIELHSLPPESSPEADHHEHHDHPAGHACRGCRSRLTPEMFELARRLGIAHLASGANLDDPGDVPPEGAPEGDAENNSAQQLPGELPGELPGAVPGALPGAVAPLVQAGMNRAAVRAAALAMGLPNWDKAAAGCRSGRVQFRVQGDTRKEA